MFKSIELAERMLALIDASKYTKQECIDAIGITDRLLLTAYDQAEKETQVSVSPLDLQRQD